MPLFPLIPSLLTKISFMVPGIRFLLIVLQQSLQASGMATELNVLFIQISSVFIRAVKMKPGLLFIGENQILPVSRAVLQHQLMHTVVKNDDTASLSKRKNETLFNFFLEVTLPFSFTSKLCLDSSDVVQSVWMSVVRKGWQKKTVSFVFRGFGLPTETCMLKLLLFSE